MNLQDEKNKIDIFLKNVSAEEFDDILEKCGINEIPSGEADNKELLFNTPNDIEGFVYCGKNIYNDNQNLSFSKVNLNNKFKKKEQRNLIRAA
ncbi:hypothetical protein GTH52_09615 [Clostridium tyrobutyricum]|jgi:hypothetical protein|uniref:Uncharacterized protein n=1 Tax=Clostridium tyrobutyricum DIVETGP TaxID=1408889 RepID=W6N3V0_CLOTY|nr:hypothetical protein [Clostridium tyrobutyricum]AND83755.1 hypothetical protein CTK_C04850 [Clostridium tyrobutyricum]ANP68515.1 hypothetical protein BA182_02145 [Clostridium tyrobutyricum]MBV4432702.1 hypothetical protein [Clostridium tyrobutyricum]MBV4433772.1 hypothetical protein [Clostridium tyrobutyricum]MBV4438603.1 hypothetical protein [Clostridium tyrobutyricum]